MRPKSKSGRFSLREISVTQHGFRYTTFELCGRRPDGSRYRRRFKDRAAALGEQNRLEVEAANAGEVRARPTRLTPVQLAEAEAAFIRLGKRSLTAAVDWYVKTYDEATAAKKLSEAQALFATDRADHVRPVTLRDYTATLDDFREAVGDSLVHEITTGQIEAFLRSRGVGKKRWNNLRGDLHAFFEWCAAPQRRFLTANPAAPVAKFKIVRGLPHIERADHLRAFFTWLETYTGDYGQPQPAGFLVPYFALATFAGMRPSVAEGEIFKLGGLDADDLARAVDLDLSVIRVGPAVAKTNDVRQITIQPNLRAWLSSYPLRDYPIRPPNLKLHVTRVRERWGFKDKDDVLRHTFISMFVAKFKSLGQAALEAGNSEAMIKKHYLNLVSQAEADAFWAIAPAR